VLGESNAPGKIILMGAQLPRPGYALPLMNTMLKIKWTKAKKCSWFNE
jgi:hypothetical protein